MMKSWTGRGGALAALLASGDASAPAGEHDRVGAWGRLLGHGWLILLLAVARVYLGCAAPAVDRSMPA